MRKPRRTNTSLFKELGHGVKNAISSPRNPRLYNVNDAEKEIEIQDKETSMPQNDHGFPRGLINVMEPTPRPTLRPDDTQPTVKNNNQGGLKDRLWTSTGLTNIPYYRGPTWW